VFGEVVFKASERSPASWPWPASASTRCSSSPSANT
jgi:hypothetical protein